MPGGYLSPHRSSFLLLLLI
uniref:Uncharacterized protein n=1 Tax=Arundo donax TaxID=35708 RepID=A0A0A9B519_ARUDO